MKKSDSVHRKFSDVIGLDGWMVQTDSGWQELVDIKKTIQYDVWELKLDDGLGLRCADDHIVFYPSGQEVFVKDLDVGDLILTKFGVGKVTIVRKTDDIEEMFDVEVASNDHRFYTGDILSHNTTVAAGYLLWFAMFKPDTTTLVASNKFEGASEIMQRIRYAYESCPDHIRAGVTSYNKKSLEFDNGSRIIAQTTTPNTGRGLSISMLYLDELGFVEPHIAREMWTSLSPTLSTGGKCIITSTPNVEDDVFADIWFGANDLIDEHGEEQEIGKNGFKPYFADWTAHPDRDEEWAKKERHAVGDAKFAREHLCEFVTFEETLINSTVLSAMKGEEPAYRTGHVRWYKDINENCTYLVALDPSMGTGGDFAAIQVFELPTMVQVAEWKHNKTRIEDQVSIMRDLTKDIDSKGAFEIYWSVENNSLGEAALVTIRDLGEETFAGSMLHDPVNKTAKRRKGFTTTPRSKQEACAMLKRLVERGTLKIKSKSLIAELKTFISAGGTYRAKNGAHDDLVMSLILILRMSDFVATWDDKAQIALRSIDSDEEEEDDYDAPMPFSFL